MAQVFQASSILFEKIHHKKLDEILEKTSAKHGEYSVFIPAYNEEKHIRETLDSILNSSILPYEIIIVNDASTDNTYKVIKEYINQHKPSKINSRNLQYTHKVYDKEIKDEFKLEIYKINHRGQNILIKIINNKNNLGKTLNFNKVILGNLVEKEYLLTVDADVIVSKNFAERMLKILKYDPKIAAAFGTTLPKRDLDTIIGKILEYGRRLIYRLAFLTFRNAGNFIDFHYGLSGGGIIFRVSALKDVPRPYDSYAGDTSHAWELQRRCWKIYSEWKTYRIAYEPSTLLKTLKQRIRWSSGPYQNLYLRGLGTIKDCFKISKKRGFGALYTIIYYTALSTKYNLLYLSLLPLSLIITSLQNWAIRFYLLDMLGWLTVSSIATYYFNRYYKNHYNIKTSLKDYIKEFLSFYFVFKPITAFSQIYAMFQTIYNIIKHKKWFGKN